MSKSFGSKLPKVPHLVQGGGVPGEIGDVRNDIEEAFVSIEDLSASGSGPLCVEDLTNLAASAATAIKTAAASAASASSFSGAALNGSIGAGAISPPRTILITTAGTTPADAPATATITGVDVNGAVISETINVPQTATTAEGAKAFAKVTSITMPAGEGTGATVAFGTGLKVGLAQKAKVRGGAVHVLGEMVDGARVVTGTFVAPATGAPNGTYSPATAANGTHDYVITYERDLS